MKISDKTRFFLMWGCLFSLLFAACSEDEDHTLLKNDCVKWTNGPNIAGLEFEYGYEIGYHPHFRQPLYFDRRYDGV
jgi:hypothetical protein